MIPEKDLTKYDYQLLKEVSEHPGISIEDLSKLLPQQKAIRIRAKLLSISELRTSPGSEFLHAVPDTRYLALSKDQNTVTITERGILALENQQCRENEASILRDEMRFWKIFVAAASLASLASLIKSFSPQIIYMLRWLSNSL